ncbi:DegT/DnrJ/EryC1/StrS family aminotransferase, partial [Gemmatimonas sp.]|uniref:DegT/DnrJ/EryC1/StrS family aminotransferase n=1 Tax=Gemmatimonas sp. TaxID=1962908 RepID=UPI003566C44C
MAPIRDELIAAFEQVLDSGHYILGPEVRAFEDEFARYLDVPFATGMSNGTCSLHIAFRCLDLEPGAEIITAPNSFIASASTIALAGATPVFVDVDDDLNIDVAQIEAAITPRTRAIVPVHLAARPARMPEIMAIAEQHG